MKNKINSIQYLRAFAAILVVYTHSLSFINGGGDSYQGNFFFLKKFGAIGVDLFFVISGFIISYVSYKLNGKREFLEFLKKRFLRVNPTYYIASLFALILRFISKPDSSFPSSEVIKSFTIIPIIDHGPFSWKPMLPVGWTLAFEWLFYLLFALLILLSVRKKFVAVILIIGGLTFLGYILPLDNIQYKFITSPIIWEFGMGVLIYLVYSRWGNYINKQIGIGMLVCGGLLYIAIILKGYGVYSEAHANTEAQANYNSLFYWYRTILWGFPSAMIVFGCIFWEKGEEFKSFFSNKTILLLGDASFAIYLVHTLVISFINKFIKYLDFIPADVLVIVAVIIGIVTGVFYYLFIESKMTKFFSKYYIRKKTQLLNPLNA
jgi:peptidoglycan/LPS O-acetylase OafA/YrhL